MEYLKVKNASIKWAYRQPTSRGWCQLPPNIGYRFDSGNKHNMRSLMEHIEQSMREMIKLAEATLDDPLDQQVMQSRVRWTAAVIRHWSRCQSLCSAEDDGGQACWPAT